MRLLLGRHQYQIFVHWRWWIQTKTRRSSKRVGTGKYLLSRTNPQAEIDYLRHSHVALIATWDHPFHDMTLPNKIFDYMAGGCPVVAAARGEIAELIKAGDCGWAVEPGKPDKLAALLQAVSKMPQKELKQKGSNGRAYVIRKYLRRDFAYQLERLFLEQRLSQSRRILSPTWTR